MKTLLASLLAAVFAIAAVNVHAAPLSAPQAASDQDKDKDKEEKKSD